MTLLRRPRPHEPPAVVGLDLSLRATAAVLIPPRWQVGDWRRLAWVVTGHKLPNDASLLAQVARLVKIELDVQEFVLLARIREGAPGEVVVAVEQYAMSPGKGQGRAHAAGELGGVVKVGLWRCLAVVCRPVSPASARKLLLGVGTGPGIKEEVYARLRAHGAPFPPSPHERRTSDVADAFAVANWMRGDLGLPALTLAPRK